MFHARKIRGRIDFQRRYEAYARNHGMTRAQMLVHDRECWPEAALKPFLLWCSSKQIEWLSLCHESGLKTLLDFDLWIDELKPELDAFTCECHKRRWQPPSK